MKEKIFLLLRLLKNDMNRGTDNRGNWKEEEEEKNRKNIISYANNQNF